MEKHFLELPCTDRNRQAGRITFTYTLGWWLMVKRLPTMRETPLQSLGWEDLLEKEMATHSSVLAWKIPWTEEPVGYSPWGRRVGHD